MFKTEDRFGNLKCITCSFVIQDKWDQVLQQTRRRPLMFLDTERQRSVISAFESLKVSGGLYQACSSEQEVWFPSWRTRTAAYQSLQHRGGGGERLAAEAWLQAQLTFTLQSAPTLMSCEVLNPQHSLADTDAPELQTPKENFQPSLSLHVLGQTPCCSCQTELNSDQIIFTERRRSAVSLREAVNSLDTLWWIRFLRTAQSGILLDRFKENGCDGKRGRWLVEQVFVLLIYSQVNDVMTLWGDQVGLVCLLASCYPAGYNSRWQRTFSVQLKANIISNSFHPNNVTQHD